MKAQEYTIKLLKIEHLDKEYYSFDFSKPEGFEFVEGQFGVFTHVNKVMEGKPFRAFSIASTNEEPFLKIATKITSSPSEFKQRLLNLALGEEVILRAPMGDFKYDETQKAVFIAGGIGITPIRSIILSMKRLNENRLDTLIYSELESTYPFSSELESTKKLEVFYSADIEPTQKLITDTINIYQNKALYYLSGSPGFVKGITELLKVHGILETKIIYDVFVGY
ncbi:MAG: FAD-dependent oxidoreductase [Firmicutes bacterium]|nr:FAD-dependent oxidoreductase [Bacillota bacterium]